MRAKKQRTDGYRGRWLVTGISRLTREREAITLPCQRDIAQNIYDRERKKPANKRVYTYLKLERAQGGRQRYSVRLIQIAGL